MEMSKLINDMSNCEQTHGMSVLEHGQSVRRYYEDLIDHLQNDTPLQLEWKLPTWIYDHKDYILENLMDDDIIKDYQIFHDCGKPYCRTVDAEGRVHFPDHAKVSEQTWLNMGGNLQVGKLIGMDMDIHLLKDAGVTEFAKNPEVITLLLTGLSEIHSNCAMFGGIESTSFKIKWKQINKRGNAIFKKLL